MTAVRARSASSARSTARKRPPAAPRRGSQTPRIYTRPLRPLEPRTPATEKRTLGYAAIDFAEQVLGISLHPWQCWLLVHLLELLPSGDLRFRTVVVLVARQNGKTTLSTVLALFFMYVLGRQLVIGTAQDLDVAEEIWQSAVDLVTELDEDEEPVRPDLYELHERTINVNGKKALVLKTGERYKVKAANRRAGRSLSGDLILLDELREHQTWDAWGAITKTTMARAFALILCLSNAGDDSSVVLHHLRLMAHLALGNPDGLDVTTAPDDAELDDEFADDLGIFEWSAPPGCLINDWDGLAQANPSLGYTITERAVASAMHTDPEWVFRTEVMCQWVAIPSDVNSPIDSTGWDDTEDANRGNAPEHLRAFGVEVDLDRAFSSVAAAGRREDGKVHLELVNRDRGIEWLVPYCKDLNDNHGPAKFAIDSGGPTADLIADFRLAGLTVVEAGLPDVILAAASLVDAVNARTVAHGPQPELDAAVAGARKRTLRDGAFAFGRRVSTVDITPLVAVALAHWLVTRLDERAPINNVW